MELQNQTKNSLQGLIRKYQNKKMDLNFFYQVIEIINEKEKFFNKIITREVDDIPTMSTSAKTMEIKINSNFIENCIEQKFDMVIKNCKTLNCKIAFYNNMYAFGLFHEIGHFIQLKKAIGEIESPEIIQKMHQIWRSYFMINEEEQKKFAIASVYSEHHDFLFFEREANIFALELLYDLFEDKWIKNGCGASLLENWEKGYIDLGPVTNSPVEYTLELLNENISLSEIEELSFLEKLNSGLPLNGEEIDALSKINLDYYQKKIGLDKAISRIRKKTIND